MRHALRKKSDRSAASQQIAGELECLLIFRDVLAGVDSAIERQRVNRSQEERDHWHPKKRRLRKKRNTPRKRDEDQRRIDQTVRMIENKDDALSARHNGGVDRLDAAKKEAKRDAEYRDRKS